MSKLTRGRKLFIGIFGTIGLAILGSGIYMTRLPEDNEWKDKGGPMIAVGCLFMFICVIMWINPMVSTYHSLYPPVYPPTYAAYPPAYAPFYPNTLPYAPSYVPSYAAPSYAASLN